MMMSRKSQKELDLHKTTTYHAGIVQASVHRNLQRVSEEALVPYGISKMQWMIVGTVLDHRKTGMRITDLSKILGTNLPYMTNTVNLLESKNILTRIENNADSRSRLVTVHKNFVSKCKNIEKELREALRKEVYSKVSPEEFQAYMTTLAKLDS